MNVCTRIYSQKLYSSPRGCLPHHGGQVVESAMYAQTFVQVLSVHVVNAPMGNTSIVTRLVTVVGSPGRKNNSVHKYRVS